MRVRLAAAVLLGAHAGAASATDEKAVPLVLRLEEQADTIWSAMPSAAGDPRVTRIGDAGGACVTSALGEARWLLGRKQDGAGAALREVSLDLAVPRSVADRLARGEPAPSLLAPYLTPATRGAQIARPLGDASCGAYVDLRRSDGGPLGLSLVLQLEAGCGCTHPGLRLHLTAQAALWPGAVAKGVLRLRAGDARYEILASCEPCDAAAAPDPTRLPVASADPCGSLCAPLARGLAAWQRKVTDAAARLEDLAGKATTLELQVATDRQELAGAQSARSKPRAVLEKISALQARIKSAEAELARVRQASRDVERTLSALRRVAGDTEGAEGRCRAQCQARPPQQQAAAEPGASGASAGGGGLSTGVLVAGGVALAAGGAVALSAGGSGAADAPAGPPDISGPWHGTKLVTSEIGTPNVCRGTFEEDWQIRQDGTRLEIAVSSIITRCGVEPGCGGNCIEGAPPLLRRHLGTISGSTAFVYPYPDLQTPDCAVPLAIQGSTMRGSMAACGRQAMEIVMQRVGP